MYKSSEISTIKDCDIDNPEAEKNISEAEKPETINLKDNVDYVTIIVGSTNFFFNFKDTKETLPVLLLFHKEEKFFGEEVINKLQKIKNQSMIFFDFLYYLDKIYETSKETLIKRNLYNKDLSFIDKKLDNLDVKEKMEFENNIEKTISFEYAYLSTNNNSHVDKDGKKIIPSHGDNQKLYSGLPFYYDSKTTNLKKPKNEIIVIMNMIKRTLKFLVDNEDKGDSYKDIPLDKPLSPALLIYDEGDSLEIINYED
jgi:hypothetical protein